MVSAPFTPAKVRKALQTALLAAKAVRARVALTGGTALEAWGVARATQDIDLVFLIPPARLAKFQKVLREHGAHFIGVRGDARMAWLRVLIQGIQIDWIRAWDLPTQQALRRAVVRPVLGTRLKVLRPEDLILLKLRVGRPRDLDDAVRLYTLLSTEMDQRYLKKSVRKLAFSKEWSYLVRSIPPSEG